MKTLLAQVRARPHLLISVAAGAVVAALAPAGDRGMTHLLLGWNTAVWLYLLQVFWIMARADHQHLHRTAVAQAEGHAVVLGIAIVAVIASVAAIGFELSGAKGASPRDAWAHVAFALATVTGCWLLLPTLFALSYASTYFTHEANGGLGFPGDAKAPRRYGDFLYFSFTIAVASQTSDIVVTTTSMRRVVIVQSLLSFGFNTAILAMAVNTAASLF